MTWVRLDDDTPGHPKYLSFGNLAPLALALQVRALCYANHYLTDGHIPAAALPQLLQDFATCQPDTGEVLDWPALMVEAGIWERNGRAGYLIHDYAQFQRSRAQVEADREVRRTVASAGGRARAAHAQRAGGRFQPSHQQPASGEAGPAAGVSPAAHQPRPGPGPYPKDKDVAPTSRTNGPTPLREVLDGQRLRLTPQPPTPPAPTEPGPNVPW